MEQAKLNKKKWLLPPDIDMITDFLSHLGVSAPSFESFYGIPKGTIRGIRHGNRSLPAKYWHIIYDKVEPKFGSGFLEQKDRIIKKAPQSIIIVTNNVTKQIEMPELKGRLADLAK